MSTEKKKEELQKSEQPKAPVSASERFTNRVMQEFNDNVAGGLEVTDYQRTLVQGYFVGIDRCLQMQEEARIRKNANNSDHKYDNDLPYDWNNVNLKDLALDVVHYARMGLDMMQKNHISPIPYKNNKTQKYDINLMPGYNGIEYVAKKYALDVPKAVTIELVYSTDTFTPVKKSMKNPVESYIFEINSPFDRGDIKGGFGYIEYEDSAKNELVIMSLNDILKRKPAYASVEFWGGTKKEKDGGSWKEVQCEGWFAEMCLKTIKREVYGAKHIPLDPAKIDADYQYMKMREARIAELEAQEEIKANANTIIIEDFSEGQDTAGKLPEGAPSEDLP